MSKFCGKCGSRLDEQTGKCPNCDKNANDSQVNDNPATDNYSEQTTNNTNIKDKKLTKKEIKSAKKAEKKQAKKDRKKAKRASMSIGQKIRRFFLKLLLFVLLLAVLAAGVTGTLVYYKVVDVPVINKLLTSVGLEREEDKSSSVTNGTVSTSEDDDSAVNSHEVTPSDADSYFQNNSTIISEIDINDSDKVHTEAEVYNNLIDRGFNSQTITTEYSMEGEYYKATDISDSSSSKHPVYQTYYVTENQDVWTIFEINGAVMANPVSYNAQSGLDVQVIISESDSVTSYDSATNKFYETIPDESSLIVKTVSRIDSETLENLTSGEIDAL